MSKSSQDIRNQERLLPGLAMVTAATIGGAALVRGVNSLPIRIIAPLAATAVAAYYCLPDHAHWHNGSTRVPLTSATATAAAAATASNAAAKTLNKYVLINTAVPTNTTGSTEFKPRSIVVDKTIANAAIKQHDAVINRSSVVGKTVEGEKNASRFKDESLQSVKDVSASISKSADKHADAVKKGLSKSKGSHKVAAKDVDVVTPKPGQELDIDKSLSKAAFKQHDTVINRGGSRGEERTRKVHKSVNTGLPAGRQGRSEIHKIDISREAAGREGNKYVVHEIPIEERNSNRSERGL